MASLSVNTDGISRFTGDLRASRGLVLPAVRLSMLRGTALVTKNVKETIRSPGGGFGPLIAGKANNMMQSWSDEVTGGGLRGASFSSKIYSSVMDQGRRPGAKMPPVQAIENWIRDKGIVEKQEKAVKALGRIIRGGKGFRLGKAKKVLAGEARERHIKSLAFVFARSIGRKGIVGRRFVQKALGKSWPHLQKLFDGVADIILQPILRLGP